MQAHVTCCSCDAGHASCEAGIQAKRRKLKDRLACECKRVKRRRIQREKLSSSLARVFAAVISSSVSRTDSRRLLCQPILGEEITQGNRRHPLSHRVCQGS